MRRLLIPSVLIVVLAACATSPTGRRQLQLFPEAQMDSMGVQAYQQMQQQTPSLEAGPTVDYVQCVTRALLEQVPPEYARGEEWEVTVFRSEAVNAFALPGGKIGVYTGLLEVAETPSQLAAVIGHEIGHVMAEHGNARMSAQMATSVGLTAAAILLGDSPESRLGLAALGLGAQVGVLLPFSRSHESEADRIGLELMAEAGFDPRQAVELWRNMAEASGGGGPPEFLSTHPSEDTRIGRLQEQMPQAMESYERARFDGETPQCTPPENVPAG